VAGRAFKILGNELPTLGSRFARIALAVVGAAALVLGGVVYIVNSSHETDTALAPDRTITSSTERTPAPGGPVTITSERTPATTPVPGRPVAITNTAPGAANVSPTANPPTVTADSSVVEEAADRNVQNTNGLCMTLTYSGMGAGVVMAPCHPERGYTLQAWRVYRSYNIQNTNGLCMTLTYNGPGAGVVMAPCHPEPGYSFQKWTWRGDGDYNIQNVNDLCMDLASNAPGTPVSMVPCQPEHTSQKWHWRVLR
jgi:hypothetical protein